MNDEHRKKMIAPIVITVLLVMYYLFYFGVIIAAIGKTNAVILGILPLVLGGTSIYVCCQRIREIKSGEEDDLDRY